MAKAVPAKTLFGDIKSYIEKARLQTAQAVNASLVALYWQIGKRIRQEILKDKRADYGEQIVATLSRQLVQEYGSGFSEKSLQRMVQFYRVFPQGKIVASLMRQLGWSHFVEIIPIADSLKRDFYAEMCRMERWSVRTLRDKIRGMLFERTAIAKKPSKLIKMELAKLSREDHLTPDLVFRDPYTLDFLGLKEGHTERDLETAILKMLEEFLLELGSDFTFLARQKRISVDYIDYYLDLLFYHRGMRRLVAIELKLGKFTAADKGQMELYLRWLDKYERKEGEEAPLGLILCAEKSSQHVELLELEKSRIRVAQYLTQLPSKRLFVQKLHEAVVLAKEQTGKSGSLRNRQHVEKNL